MTRDQDTAWHSWYKLARKPGGFSQNRLRWFKIFVRFKWSI